MVLQFPWFFWPKELLGYYFTIIYRTDWMMDIFDDTTF